MESASGGSKYEANRADVDWRVVDRHFPMRSRPGSGPDFARSGAVVNGRLVLQKMAGSEVAPPSPPASGTPAWTNLRYLGSTGVGLQRFNHSSVYDLNTDRMIAFVGDEGDPLLDTKNDLLVLANANGLGGTPQWTVLLQNGATGSPTARELHTAVYDATNNRMIVSAAITRPCFSTTSGS